VIILSSTLLLNKALISWLNEGTDIFRKQDTLILLIPLIKKSIQQTFNMYRTFRGELLEHWVGATLLEAHNRRGSRNLSFRRNWAHIRALEVGGSVHLCCIKELDVMSRNKYRCESWLYSHGLHMTVLRTFPWISKKKKGKAIPVTSLGGP
jgi:hypothetical protein